MFNWFLREQEKKKHLEEVKKRILDEENDRLPMTIQELEDVEDITIDDLSFSEDPGCYYTAYLHTTWEVYVLKGSGFFELGQPRPANNLELVKRRIYVRVGIFEIGTTLEWKTGWLDAYKEHMRKIEVYD
jgi:hypothetical protein